MGWGLSHTELGKAAADLEYLLMAIVWIALRDYMCKYIEYPYSVIVYIYV
jgi:hypothetical protein